MKRLLLALVVTLLSVPTVQAQYLSPEDVLLYNQNASQVPTSRRAARTAAEQQASSSNNQARPTFQEWWTKPAEESSSVSGDLHLSPPVQGDTEGQTTVTQGLQLDPVTARLLLRLQHQREVEQQQQQYGMYLTDPNDPLHSTALHSGAPLAGSGPAETASLVVLAGAVGWTLWRSKGMKQFEWGYRK